eukprot:Filipodium_phascolosomae@DN7959_c0_g1_i1.p2
MLCLIEFPPSDMSEVTLTCIRPDENKGWTTNETYLGELVNGYLLDVDLKLGRQIMGPKVPLLEAIANRVAFEAAGSANGRVWVKADDYATVTAIVRCLSNPQAHRLTEAQAEILVKKIFDEF